MRGLVVDLSNFIYHQNPSCVGKGRDSLILTLATNPQQRCQQGLSRNYRACSGELKVCRRRISLSRRAWTICYSSPRLVYAVWSQDNACETSVVLPRLQWTCGTSVDSRFVAGSVLELRRQVLVISGGPLIRTLNRARLPSILPLPTQGHAPPGPQPTSLHAPMGHRFEKA